MEGKKRPIVLEVISGLPKPVKLIAYGLIVFASLVLVTFTIYKTQSDGLGYIDWMTEVVKELIPRDSTKKTEPWLGIRYVEFNEIYFDRGEREQIVIEDSIRVTLDNRRFPFVKSSTATVELPATIDSVHKLTIYQYSSLLSAKRKRVIEKTINLKTNCTLEVGNEETCIYQTKILVPVNNLAITPEQRIKKNRRKRPKSVGKSTPTTRTPFIKTPVVMRKASSLQATANIAELVIFVTDTIRKSENRYNKESLLMYRRDFDRMVEANLPIDSIKEELKLGLLRYINETKPH